MKPRPSLFIKPVGVESLTSMLRRRMPPVPAHRTVAGRARTQLSNDVALRSRTASARVVLTLVEFLKEAR